MKRERRPLNNGRESDNDEITKLGVGYYCLSWLCQGNLERHVAPAIGEEGQRHSMSLTA